MIRYLLFEQITLGISNVFCFLFNSFLNDAGSLEVIIIRSTKNNCNPPEKERPVGETHWSTKTQCENTMPKTYTRLTEDERYQIYEGIVHGISHRVIAKQLGRSPSTVSREIARNKGLRGLLNRKKNIQHLIIKIKPLIPKKSPIRYSVSSQLNFHTL